MSSGQPARRPRIYISYEKRDAEPALKQLRDALKEAGYDDIGVWTVPSDQAVRSRTIERLVRQADGAVVLVTRGALDPNGITEREVRPLVERASSDAEFRVVPLLADEVAPVEMRGTPLAWLADVQTPLDATLEARIAGVLHGLRQLQLSVGRTLSQADATQTSRQESLSVSVTFVAVRLIPTGTRIAALALGELDGRPTAVTGGEDATVRIWDLTGGEPQDQQLRGHTGAVWAIALGQIHRDQIVVSASNDRTLRVWDLPSGQLRGQPLTGHTALVNAVALGLLEDQLVAVSASDDHTLRVWNLVDGRLHSILTGHTDWVNGVATTLLPDGRLVAVSGSTDRTVRVWDLATGQSLTTLTGHTDGVRTVAVDELDGRLIVVSGSNDHTVRIWPLEGDAPSQQLDEHTGPVRAVAIGEVDGRSMLVSGGDDNTLRIWEPVGIRRRDQVEWLSDAPSNRDLLRRRPLAQALAARLRRIHAEEPDTSFLVHIDGPWGPAKVRSSIFCERSWVKTG